MDGRTGRDAHRRHRCGAERLRVPRGPNGLGFYREIGYGNAEVIELATTTTAGALGLGKDTGHIAPEYAADLLVVEGDPLYDLANHDRQTRVLRNGRTIARAA